MTTIENLKQFSQINVLPTIARISKHLLQEDAWALINSQIRLSSGRRWRTLTDASTVMTVHRLLSSAMHSNDASECPVHSLRSSSAITTFYHSMYYGFRQRIISADMAEPW